ncbi:MAG: Rpn family recombination-promoting nuclease/putative transposase [Planctomycetota bacterium]
MEDAQLPTPHNNLFHYAFSHATAVRSLLETHLPTNITGILDLSTLTLQKDSFIDPRLRESHADLLYSVQMLRQGESQGDALVYILLEHKSQSDELTCFQLLRYIVRIWEQRQRDGQPLCPVVPLVIYHGETAWSATRSVEELKGVPQELLDCSVRFSFPLLDLGQVPDESLSTDPFLQSILNLLKYGRRRDLADRLERIFQWLLEHGATKFRKEHLDAIVVYIMATSVALPMETLTMTVQKIFPTQIEPGSIADQLLKKGREEGREEGELFGRIRLLQKLLGLSQSTDEELITKSSADLDAMATELQAQLRMRMT